MDTIINDCLMVLNDVGRSFCDYAGNVFIQSSVLIVLLLIVDFLIRKRVRAIFRYWIWMLVFVKLILPPTLSLPTGIGYWCGGYFSADSVLEQTTTIVQQESTAGPIAQELPETSEAPLTQEIAKSVSTTKSQDTPKTAEMPPIQPSKGKIEKATPILPDRVVLNPITWQAVIFGFWLVGVLVISVLLIQRILFVRGLIAQGEAADEQLVEIMNRCRQKVGVSQNIEIRLSNTVMSPAVCGLFKPIVLIPKSLLDTLSPDNLRAVLIHELAHIKRGDLWINCVQTILQIIYFYNPFVWLANAIVRKIREQAVDEMVLVALGAEAKSYSNTLIDIAEIAFFRASLSLRLIGVVESKKELHRRIKHMLNRPIPKSAKIGLWGLLAIMVIGAVLLPMAKAQVGKESQIAGVEEQFTETLPQNITVRFAGICDWPEEGRRCWRPDGSRLPVKIYASKWNVKPGFGDYGFMFEVNGPNDLNFTCHKIDGASSSEGSCKVVDEQGNQLEGYEATISDMEEGRLTTKVRVGIATGPWTTIASHDGKQMSIGRQEGVLWSQAFQTENSTNVVASVEWRKDQVERVVAIDKEGKLHTTGHGSVASGKVDQLTASFRNLKLGQIEKFLYQTRPYQWITFNNVSLKPGSITRVQVVTSSTPDVKTEHKPVFTSTLPNGATVELVGVSRNPTQGEQWWRPDGSLLAKPPYHSRGGGVVIEDDDEYKAYQFVARVKEVSGENVKWRVPGGTQSTYTGQPMDEAGQRISDLRALAVNQPREKNSAVVRICIAAGEWETVATNDSKKEETYGVDGGSVSFGVPYEKDGVTYLPVTYTKEGLKNKAIRVFAIDYDGNAHTGSISGSGGNVLSSMTYEFRLSLEDIREFQFKTRPYQWVTFNNVSLKPNFKTDVQVEVEKAEQETEVYIVTFKPIASFRPRSARELLGAFNENHPDRVRIHHFRTEVKNRQLVGHICVDTEAGRNAVINMLEGSDKLDFVSYRVGTPDALKQLYKMGQPSLKADVQTKVEGVPTTMVGTWFFDNPHGDEEQMAVFPDGRVVVLYSNGHKDQTNYLDGFIELAEYDNARCKMVIREDGMLVQYFTHNEGEQFGKRWKRIDPMPRTNLLRPLTGATDVDESVPFFRPVDSPTKAELLKQMGDMTEGMIQAFNEGNVGILLSYFTSDAIVLPDQQEAAIGEDALRKHYLQQLAQQAKIRSLKDIERQIWICGDYVFEVSNFVASITSPGSRFVLSDWQKNLAVFRKHTDGSLKLRLTSSNPMPVPEGGSIPEAVEPDAIRVVSSPRPSSLPLNVSEQIKKSESIFHKKFIERDAEGAAEFYAENAVLLRWGEDVLESKSEILEDIKKSMQEEPLVDMTQEVVHVEGNNQMLFVVNMFTWTFKGASTGENVTWPGKGVHVWTRQQDGSWKILLDLYNLSVPIPGQ